MSFNKQKQDGSGLVGSNVYVAGDDFYILRGGNTQTDANTNTTAAACFVRDATTVFAQSSAAKVVGGSTSDLPVGAFAELAVDINITTNSGTSPTIQFFLDRKGADGVHYMIWSSSVITTTTGIISASIGAGCNTNQSFGSFARLRWSINGTSPSWTFSASIIGK